MGCRPPSGEMPSHGSGDATGSLAEENDSNHRLANMIDMNPPSPDLSATSSSSACRSHITTDNAAREPSACSDSTPPTSVVPTPEHAPVSGQSPSTRLDEKAFPLPKVSSTSIKSTLTKKKPNALTSESLLPLDRDGSAGSTSSRSAPSVASSSEAHDLLGPLPIARPITAERPSLSRAQMTLSRQSSSARIPLPSPPAMGLSELLSGTTLTPGSEQSYFASHSPTEPSTLSRSSSGSRRTPQYSPFRSYYGDVAKTEPPRQQERSKTDARPGPHPVAATSKARSDTSSTYDQGQGKRDPRVQNNDGVLAPHGSFTTRKRDTADVSRPAATSKVATSDSQLYLGGSRRSGSQVGSVDQDQRKALEKAAMKGDQLAMYRLGWRADSVASQRYHLGSVENVWGLTSPNMSAPTRRSSRSSRGSIGSYPSPPLRPESGPPSPYSRMESDLFSDAAGLALRSSAAGNIANRPK